MKTTLLAVAVLWAGAAAAQTPQSPPPGGPGPGAHHETAAQRMDDLAILLDLTDEQKAEVGAVLQEEYAKMKELHEQAKASGQKPSFEEMRAQHQQLQQETLTQLTPLLSPAQLKKFQILMEHRGPGRRGP